jgi:hypothetical protein
MDNYTLPATSPTRGDQPTNPDEVATNSKAVENDFDCNWLLSPEELLRIEAPQSLRNINATLDQVADYVELNWSIVPQLPGEKSPCVKWKPYQTERPSTIQFRSWFTRWPDAGPTVVLGLLSNVFAIDVDGKEAHDELVRRLGKLPDAPKVLSGSGRAYRYHLFFAYPPVATRAKFTPWHPKLEFRGQGGITVLPPSVHKSGNRYQWAPGKSLGDISPPPLPEPIVAVLREHDRPRHVSIAVDPEKELSVRVVSSICHSTREFLGGKFAHADGWNSRLFGAACDMAGNGVPLARALPLLIAGAQPWGAAEEARAIATIQSAFSQPRVPARLLHKR